MLTLLPVLQIIAIQTQIEKMANVAANDTDYIKIDGESQKYILTAYTKDSIFLINKRCAHMK